MFNFAGSTAWVGRQSRTLVISGALALLVGSALAQTPTASPPVSDFFKLAAVTAMIMSPSGKSIAMVARAPPQNRLVLLMIDIADPTKLRPIAYYNDSDVFNVQWVNDERLVFSVWDSQAPAADQYRGGLFSVDREGKTKPNNLIRRTYGDEDVEGEVRASAFKLKDRQIGWDFQYYATLDDGSNGVIVRRINYDSRGQPNGSQALVLDAVTGQTRNLASGVPEGTYQWLFDAKGNVRGVVTAHDNTQAFHWRADSASPWKKIQEWSQFGVSATTWQPYVIDAENRLYFAAPGQSDPDKLVLQRLVLTTPDARPEELVALKGYDYSGTLMIGKDHSVMGSTNLTDAWGAIWFDPAMAAIQKDIDTRQPGYSHQLTCGRCDKPSHVLIKSESDRQPAIYQLYDVKAKTIKSIASTRPWIRAGNMARQEMNLVPARDGLIIPTYVTRPVGKSGPQPAVVMVHGGPWLRSGDWTWDADAQFLASRGYVVIAPEFRGSTGFGVKHFKAGWKQWGLAMQDDVADTVNWAIKAGIVDAKRVCIAGSSYGGYSAMMGLVRHSDMYQCAINWVGVTDVEELMNTRWSDLSDASIKYGFKPLVGDPKTDSARLTATSPLKQAAAITKPVLLAYGGADWRVPEQQGFALRNALQKHNNAVEWLYYKKEGHGWTAEATNIDFWTKLDAFLSKHLAAKP